MPRQRYAFDTAADAIFAYDYRYDIAAGVYASRCCFRRAITPCYNIVCRHILILPLLLFFRHAIITWHNGESRRCR